MPTTVTHSIGTSSRDYSTLQAWEDACPANLVTADQIWKGECYNDSEFTWSTGGGTALLVMAGETTDATRYMELTAAAGQSFQDHANVRTNPLCYDQSKGVGLNVTVGYALVIDNTDTHHHFSRLQLKSSGQPYAMMRCPGAVCKDMLGQAVNDSSVFDNIPSGALIINCVAIMDSTNASGRGPFLVGTESNVSMIGCVAVRPSNRTAAGVSYGIYNGSNNVLISCVSFGYLRIADPGHNVWTSSSKNNVTDLASGATSFNGTGNTYNAAFTTATFVQPDSSAGLDLRATTSGTLAALGFRDTTNAPNDISGFTRPSSPYAGAWEAAAAAAVGYLLVKN